MILLDTNVVSEPLKPNSDPAVVAWIDAQAIDTLYLSTISVAELRYVIAVLPDGKRKDTLRESLASLQSTWRRPKLMQCCGPELVQQDGALA